MTLKHSNRIKDGLQPFDNKAGTAARSVVGNKGGPSVRTDVEKADRPHNPRQSMMTQRHSAVLAGDSSPDLTNPHCRLPGPCDVRTPDARPGWQWPDVNGSLLASGIPRFPEQAETNQHP